eukprot:2642246-Rhodomonas_salina.2
MSGTDLGLAAASRRVQAPAQRNDGDPVSCVVHAGISDELCPALCRGPLRPVHESNGLYPPQSPIIVPRLPPAHIALRMSGIDKGCYRVTASARRCPVLTLRMLLRQAAAIAPTTTCHGSR